MAIEGIFKTYKRLQEVAFWPGMWTDVKHHVRECVKCQTLRHDNQKPAGKLQSVTTTKPNECWELILWVHYPGVHSQNVYLLVFVDITHDGLSVSPCVMPPLKVLQQFSERNLNSLGGSRLRSSDRGTQFVSSVFREVCEKWRVTPKLTTAYHPQTNMTERCE